jgi:hypothetical protein
LILKGNKNKENKNNELGRLISFKREKDIGSISYYSNNSISE